MERTVKGRHYRIVVFAGRLQLIPNELRLLHVGCNVYQIRRSKWITSGPPEVITHKRKRQHHRNGERRDYSAGLACYRRRSFSEYEDRERDQDWNAVKQALVWTTVREDCQPKSQQDRVQHLLTSLDPWQGA